MNKTGLDINVCPIPVKTYVGPQGLVTNPKTLASNISMLEPIQDNDNYKPHAKDYSNLSMFTKAIA